MNKSDLKKILKPLIKECIREAIFEEGILSGLITEVAQGLGNINPAPQLQQVVQPTTTKPRQQSRSIIEAKNQLKEVKDSLQKATGLHGIFEGTKPMPSSGGGQSNKHGPLRDKDPSDAGVNIDGLVKMTGGWSHLAE
jgi:hypothetical protein